MTTGSFAPAPPIAPPPHRRHSWVSTLVTLLGTVVILGMVTGAVLQSVRSTSSSPSLLTTSTQGVTALDLEILASDLTVNFADQPTATLVVISTGSISNRDWRMEIRNGVLTISDSNDSWIISQWHWSSDRAEAVLTLPSSLEGTIDASLDLSAGSIEMSGDLNSLDISVAAGALSFEGSSTALDAEVSAGSATIVTSGTQTVDLEVSAGSARVTVTGEPPMSTSIDVSAGRATALLPDGVYALTGDVSAGQRNIDVRTDPSSLHKLDVEVNAGRADVGYSN